MNLKLNLCLLVMLLLGLLPITVPVPVPVPVSVYGDPSYIKFFYLVLQWPNAFCNVNCCCNSLRQKFSIHGFWPQVANGNSTFCKPLLPLQEEYVHDIEKQLSIDWPNLICSWGNFGFWKYQWEKHGNRSKLDHRSYFDTAMKLKAKNVPDLLSTLRQSNIVPSETRKYQVKSIQDAIVAKIGWRPRIKCINYSNNGDVQIHEIHFCVKPPPTAEVQEFEFINCRRRPYYMGCGDHEDNEVYFSPEKNNLTATGNEFISSSLTLPRRQTQSEEEAEDEL
ncbi:hypothetical protein F0562_004411 [Nyssa sinensis]|uniref:Uncharacterized protein n=1 Tax=Nyssa sinensis TaxID=561372 RepID=A0A5J5C211_9ASTE|nr:hypothetical protein F0562_004411 [Nyssa sinensis]